MQTNHAPNLFVILSIICLSLPACMPMPIGPTLAIYPEPSIAKNTIEATGELTPLINGHTSISIPLNIFDSPDEVTFDYSVNGEKRSSDLQLTDFINGNEIKLQIGNITPDDVIYFDFFDAKGNFLFVLEAQPSEVDTQDFLITAPFAKNESE